MQGSLPSSSCWPESSHAVTYKVKLNLNANISSLSPTGNFRFSLKTDEQDIYIAPLRTAMLQKAFSVHHFHAANSDGRNFCSFSLCRHLHGKLHQTYCHLWRAEFQTDGQLFLYVVWRQRTWHWSCSPERTLQFRSQAQLHERHGGHPQRGLGATLQQHDGQPEKK